MRLTALFIGVFFSAFMASAQGKIYRFSQDAGYGYKDKKGNVRIAPGKYDCVYSTIKKPVVLQSLLDDSQWYVVDASGNELYRVYVENGTPDSYNKGLIRVQKDNLIGFTDKKGRAVIPTRYTQANRFVGKYTLANIGAILADNSSTDMDNPTTWVGGKWGVIDKKGKVIVPFSYDRVWNETEGCYEYVNGKSVFVVTEKGKIVWKKTK
ncbi:MAG TPA: WG repeat-containing protein [Paludibacteraceae bacterium]|jgi:hypothetical protein|nr:WG repeat-containing protein [Paludibacteraceae bacterium]HOU69311.1 WG repeat-containing protein [Paludibacteraceae bacterium]HQF51051.1 WG repeat-containing protein [Paludibacteraceae bacterium]HQJ90236.1 WG repeat-containing protein [Paludibacteraceae bacterium]